MMQGAGALGMVAAVAVGVAALTAGGTSGPAPAASRRRTRPTRPRPVGAPIVTAATAPAPSDAGCRSAAPTTFTVSGTVANVPPRVTLTLALRGTDGSFTAIADGTGALLGRRHPARHLRRLLRLDVDSTGTATQVGEAR